MAIRELRALFHLFGHNVAMTQPSQLTLRPMSEAEYESFRSKLVAEYARVNVEAGNWHVEESLELSKHALEQLLPQGKDTPRVLMLSADNSAGEYVGYLWIGLDRPGTSKKLAWIYDIEVAEEQRGKGYGRALLHAAEEETLRNDVPTLGLNVFGTNQVARKLYESSGYSITQISMSKTLGAEEGSA